MGDELSCGQARDWYTHTRTHRPTDAGDDNTRRPKLASGKNAAQDARKASIEIEVSIHDARTPRKWDDYETRSNIWLLFKWKVHPKDTTAIFWLDKILYHNAGIKWYSYI